jgi:hypothetical protein
MNKLLILYSNNLHKSLLKNTYGWLYNNEMRQNIIVDNFINGIRNNIK